MTKARQMIMHAGVIAGMAYIVMHFGLKQQNAVEDKSILLFGVVLTYMTLFGHSLPGSSSLNSDLFKYG